MKHISLIILFLLMVTGCDQRVAQGIVSTKKYHAPYAIFIPMYISCGKNCTSFVMIPVFYPEAYSLKINGISESGKVTTEEVYVSKGQYDLVRINDYYECTSCTHERQYERKNQ